MTTASQRTRPPHAACGTGSRTVAGGGIVLEGWQYRRNGQGRMLTTEECLLSTTQQRNPPMDRAGLRTGVRPTTSGKGSHLAEPWHRRDDTPRARR